MKYNQAPDVLLSAEEALAFFGVGFQTEKGTVSFSLSESESALLLFLEGDLAGES